MDFQFDQDLHLHSYISYCSGDPEQTPENILKKAKEAGLKQICLTDHLWAPENEGDKHPSSFKNVYKAWPLPKDDKVDFLFGCETDISYDGILGVERDKYSVFDFIIVAITHFHILTFTVLEEHISTDEKCAKYWLERLEKFLSFDLPYHKVGLAHMADIYTGRGVESKINVIKLIDEKEAERLFTKAAKMGVGIELNYCDVKFMDQDLETALKLFRIAKKCGCKFYFGSDCHVYSKLDYSTMRTAFERFAKALGITEEDKYIIPKEEK